MYTLTKIGNCDNVVRLLSTKIYDIDKELGIDIEPGDFERRIFLVIEMGDSNLEQLKLKRRKKNIPWTEPEILYILACVV